MVIINNRLSIGVDLVQRSDPTAIAVVQAEPRGGAWHHTSRFLQRLPLGTPCPEVARRVGQIASNASTSFATEMREKYGEATAGFPLLYVDATGLGQPVMDL
jgi:hypothetical protein